MDVALLIDGEDAPASGGATFERRDPFTGELASRAASGTAEDARRAADAAAAAFPAWSATGPGARRKLLLKAADLMEGRAEEFAALMTAETGSTGPWGAFNARLAAGMLREAASMTTQITGEVIPSDKPGMLSLAVRQSAGVCVGIAPWNAPVINGPTVADEPQMPFGGVKGSGYGRFGGKAAIAEFTDLRWITIESEQHYPF